MKLTIVLAILMSASAWAGSPSLYVKDGNKLLDVEKLLAAEEDIQSNYGFEDFCYQGDPHVVMTKIKAWNKSGDFFSGGGGGHELKGMKLNRGIVTYDIVLKFEDEVVPGEFEKVIVKPCIVK